MPRDMARSAWRCTLVRFSLQSRVLYMLSYHRRRYICTEAIIPDVTFGLIRIEGSGDARVSHIHEFLSDMEICYNSILLYDLLLDRLKMQPGALVFQWLRSGLPS